VCQSQNGGEELGCRMLPYTTRAIPHETSAQSWTPSQHHSSIEFINAEDAINSANS
jgi:hypothetical protein